ncbi:MAG: T9SS type A sorting domain-containing protein, partial [Paludibacter sp.]
SPATARGLTTAFASDSLKSVTLSTDTTSLTKTMFVTYYAAGFTTPGKTADYYAASDEFIVPYGNGARPNWMSFKTPWLNKGAYNVYMNQRTNLGGGMKTTATMDEKALYVPNAELNGFSIRGDNNNKKRWNANANDGLNQMSYLGSVVLDASGQHDLKLTCTTTSESSVNQIAWLDMMEFIPVDQDSVTVNISAATGLAKTYYPLFNSGGYASTTTASFITYASCNELAVPYQAVDQTIYETNPYTLQHLGVTDPNLGLLGVDYVVIFKNDQWTRVNEGAVNTSDSTYTSNLAYGDYYYQEYNYTENALTLGSLGSRLWIKDGTFTVSAPNALKNVNSSNIKTYAVGKIITVKGINVGAKIMVTDLMGRLILNTVSTSDVFTTTMKQGSVYIIKVVSGSDYSTMKVVTK